MASTSLDTALSTVPKDDVSTAYAPAQSLSEKIDKQTEEGIKKMESEKQPSAPSLPPAPKEQDYQTSPMDKFGSGAMFLTTFGSLLTKHPLTSALNSGAAVMNAYNAKDAKAFSEAMNKWKTDSEYAWKMAEWQNNLYKEDIDRDIASLRARASSSKDQVMLDMAHARMERQLQKDRERSLKQAMEGQNDVMEYVKLSKEKYLEECKKTGTCSKQGEIEAGMAGFHKIMRMKNIKEEDDTKDFDFSTAKANDIVPGTGETFAAITQKAIGLHNGSSYADLGISIRTTKNPIKDAVDNLRAKLYPDDNITDIKLKYGAKKTEETVAAKNLEGMQVATDRLDKSIPLLLEKVKIVNPDRFKSWNEFENYLNEHTGDPGIIALKQVVEDTKSDFQAVQAKGGQITDKVRDSSNTILNAAWSLGQFKAATDTMLQTSHNQMAAARQSMNSITNSSNSAADLFNDGGDKETPLPMPKDKKFQKGKYYDLSAEGHGVHKYIGGGQFE